jgi:serine/threonine protein kinase
MAEEAKRIGHGAFGRIYLSEKDGKKIVTKRNLAEKTLTGLCSLKELDLLTRFKGHANIIELLECKCGNPFNVMSPVGNNALRDDALYFVLEHAYCDCYVFIEQDIFKHRELMVKVLMCDMLLGLEYMHAKGFMHRDIKPGNFLIVSYPDGSFRGKICDFGMSDTMSIASAKSPHVVTVLYRAPELVTSAKYYTETIDIWAAGCVFFELLTKRPLVSCDKDRDEKVWASLMNVFLRNIDDELYQRFMSHKNTPGLYPNVQIPQRKTLAELINFTDEEIRLFDECPYGGTFVEFCDLVSKMLEPDPELRPTATQCIQHSFFDPLRPRIQDVREKFPPVRDPFPVLRPTNIIERKWMYSFFQSILKDRADYQWYKHGLFFVALDLTERVLEYIVKQPKISAFESNYSGCYLSQDDTYLWFLVCIYIAIKYYSNIDTIISFENIASKKFITVENMNKVDEFEKKLIFTISGGIIYRPTIYDRIDVPPNDVQIEDFVKLLSEMDPKIYRGKTMEELYSLYLRVRKSP